MKRWLLLFLFLPVLTFAAVPAWKVIPDQSFIKFTATQNNAPVSGTFKTFSADIHFDPTQLNASSVKVTINIDSLSTSYSDVATALKTAEWFDVKQFPRAVFQATQFTKIGDNIYRADGTLTIRDKTLPIALPFILERYSKTAAEATGKITIKRTQFNVGSGQWASTKEVKDDVQIELKIVASAG